MKAKKNTEISVIIPCYRCSLTIESAIASVAAQTLLPEEIILVEDASGDETLATLENIVNSYSSGWIRLISLEKNGGPAKARNTAWDLAKGKYIAFLDADDSWHPLKLELQYNALQADPSIALIGSLITVEKPYEPSNKIKLPYKIKLVRPMNLLFRNPFPTASVVLRRDLPFRFDENRRRAEDYYLWAQISFSGYRCARLNTILASWHKAPFGVGGLSGDIRAMNTAANEVRKALYLRGFINIFQFWLMNLIGAIRYFRRILITDFGRFCIK